MPRPNIIFVEKDRSHPGSEHVFLPSSNLDSLLLVVSVSPKSFKSDLSDLPLLSPDLKQAFSSLPVLRSLIRLRELSLFVCQTAILLSSLWPIRVAKYRISSIWKIKRFLEILNISKKSFFKLCLPCGMKVLGWTETIFHILNNHFRPFSQKKCRNLILFLVICIQ